LGDAPDHLRARRVHQAGEFVEVLVDQLDVAGTLAGRGDQQRALDGIADLDGRTDGWNVPRSLG
jgi:hypothetical protein